MQSILTVIPLEEGDRLYRLKCEHAISTVLFTPGPNGLTDDDVLQMVKAHHQTSTHITASWTAGGTSQIYVDSGVVAVANTWYHVAVTLYSPGGAWASYQLVMT